MSWMDQVKSWSRPPVDDVGYIRSDLLAAYEDGQLKDMIAKMEVTRMSGWRNASNKWSDMMGLSSTKDKDILDFGCGVGLESMMLARSGNRVAIADISANNLLLAGRVLSLYGFFINGIYLIGEKENTAAEASSFDVFHCNGVLHHSDHPEGIIAEAFRVLRPDGIIRLMVYSDRGWIKYMGCPPPVDTKSHPRFRDFVRTFDQVGNYADWYSREKIEALVGGMFVIEDFDYITNDDRYLACVLRRQS